MNKMTYEEQIKAYLKLLEMVYNGAAEKEIKKEFDKFVIELPEITTSQYGASLELSNGFCTINGCTIYHDKNGHSHSGKFPSVFSCDYDNHGNSIMKLSWSLNGNHIKEFSGLIKLNEAQKKKLEFYKLKYNKPPPGDDLYTFRRNS